MQEFLDPVYFKAVGMAVGYGFMVFLSLVISCSVIVGITGGPAAKHWGEAH